jgi:hypothetical protein
MSRTLEERLASALEARADLVTAEHLRPLEIPAARRRRPATVLVAAAAAASLAVVAAPFLIDQMTGTAPAPRPAGSPSPMTTATDEPSQSPTAPATPRSEKEPEDSSTPPTIPTQGIGPFRVVVTAHADLDGDGRADRIQIKVRETVAPVAGSMIDIDLAGAGGLEAYMDTEHAPEQLLEPPVRLGDGGREQLLATRSEGDSTELLVIGWDGFSDSPGVIQPDTRLRPAAGLDGQGRMTGFYVDTDGLHSWRTLEPVDPAGSSEVEVEEWSWSIRYDLPVEVAQGRGRNAPHKTEYTRTGLEPTSEGNRCADISTETAEAC